MTVLLRAIVKDDLPALQRIYRSAREPELALLPWTEEQKDSFCAMQFSAQDRSYREAYPDGEFLLIECDGAVAGRLYRAVSAGSRRVVDITLLPAWRNRGIGAALLREEIAMAEAAGMPLELQVSKSNPARELYARLGFQEIEDSGMYLRMEWRSAAKSAGAKPASRG